MAAEKKQKEEYKDDSKVFKRNAFLLIDKMVEMASLIQEDTSELVDEILHSIFFLGKITQPEFSPRQLFVDDVDMFDYLNEAHPEPFRLYSSQLPRRSPFSCVLDMVVLQKRPENEDEVKQTLSDLVNRLKKGFLVSTTICISKSSNTESPAIRSNTVQQVQQYGVSMSTSGRNPGRIMIAASCLSSYWDEYVAAAVMTFYPDKKKKEYFDGTFKLSKGATCRAYNIKKASEMEPVMKPCKSCGNLFGFQETCQREWPWPYGNCAEVESLSNLFKNDDQVKQQSRPQSDTFTPENREKVRDETLENLKKTLKTIQFKTWSGEFYVPE
ncbi:PREDICTED: uncharacterized protein LOC106922635 isoform X2 [Poecilia mexicana]|uniref:uncharacterized protein LOC106922635 isoform X2 n=1 Tax=Poecilia mexicana TaxID=48701 RepID=UPI00072E9B82|nr:PREDICTED: uncharacterized protein LOC106922635 isoform X2 [Poecilia mexicana]XP_016532717.1 PREDICTED: uncharacterized protein LOC103146012 isoform X2 [Poecilia formosa]